MTERVQCPFCMKHVRLRVDGKLVKHQRHGTRRGGRRCPGSHRTREDAKALKATGAEPVATATTIEPEDIF